jgi:hypothetical protein
MSSSLVARPALSNTRYIAAALAFTAGAVCECVTGSTWTRVENRTTNTVTTNFEYDKYKGVGIGWGTFIAALLI